MPKTQKSNAFMYDQMQRRVELPQSPQRIISLVPSQTELLFSLGLTTEVVGITKFCVHPQEWFREKTRVGGTKQYRFDVIAQLQPDLIIGNKEENDKMQIEELAEKYPVWMSDIQRLEDAYEMIGQVGKIIGKTEKAKALVRDIRQKMEEVMPSKPISAAYFIWNNPLMVAAKGTFINEMMAVAGFKNVFDNLERYPEISLETLKKADPKVILLSSEPFPFKEKHLQIFQAACPHAKIVLVDGELFSWYGSRLLHAADYFSKLHQQLKTIGK